MGANPPGCSLKPPAPPAATIPSPEGEPTTRGFTLVAIAEQGGAEARDFLVDTHEKFCELLPSELLWVEDPETKKREEVIPGALRESDVIVGRHVGISPGALPRFMARFEQAYSNLDKLNSILAVAPAHHRFLWIHPFLDGNGRVARLMSYAMLRETLDTGGIWSIARG